MRRKIFLCYNISYSVLSYIMGIITNVLIPISFFFGFGIIYIRFLSWHLNYKKGLIDVSYFNDESSIFLKLKLNISSFKRITCDKYTTLNLMTVNNLSGYFFDHISILSWKIVLFYCYNILCVYAILYIQKIILNSTFHLNFSLNIDRHRNDNRRRLSGGGRARFPSLY